MVLNTRWQIFWVTSFLFALPCTTVSREISILPVETRVALFTKVFLSIENAQLSAENRLDGDVTIRVPRKGLKVRGRLSVQFPGDFGSGDRMEFIGSIRTEEGLTIPFKCVYIAENTSRGAVRIVADYQDHSITFRTSYEVAGE